MAQGKAKSKKNTSPGRNSGAASSSKNKGKARSSSREDKRKAAKKKSFLKTEMTAIICILLGCLLILADAGLMGGLGDIILRVQRGLFGQAYLISSAAIIAAAVIGIKNRGTYLVAFKIISVFVILITLSSLLELMFGGNYAAGLTMSELYAAGADGAGGGGAAGGIVTELLVSVIGQAGAFLVFAALIIMCAVVITEKSFVSAARSGAEKTASAVRAGAGKTLEAARNGHEHYRQVHRENVIRRDALKEEERLRRLERSFRQLEPAGEGETVSDPDGPDIRGFASDGQESYSGSEMRRAELYAGYGRDIIGDSQPGVDTLGDIRMPLFRTSYENRKSTEGVSFDTGVIDNISGQSREKTSSGTVNIRQIDYESDEVPFDVSEEEEYRSYAYILNAEAISLNTARQAGFAVGDSANAGRQSEALQQQITHMAALRPHEDTGKTKADAEDAGESTACGIGDNAAELYSDIGGGSYIGINAVSEASVSEETEAGALSETVSETAVNTFNGAEQMSDAEDEDDQYISASGKQLEVPDRDEARRVLERKLGRDTGANARSGSEAESVQEAKLRQETKSQQGSGTKQYPGAKPEAKRKPRPYVYPKLNLLERGVHSSAGSSDAVMKNARKLEKVLRDFGVGVSVTNVIVGPRVSRYELTPAAGVKVSRITSLSGDIKLALAARDIRIEAPIPGKSAVGVEVPNESGSTVKFRDILESEQFRNSKSRLCWGLGLDIGGNTVISDIAKMPHILVAGTTGSGKSVGINSLIMSVLYRAAPSEVRMILVDPKQVEFTVYNGIPHLLTPVVTTPEKALSALNWAVAEMNRRYKLFQGSGTRNIAGYNEKAAKAAEGLPEENRPEKLPFILIIIDELSELMMHAKKDVESCIVSLAQLARAAGIHLVVATQRPSVDVITGLIKSNIPSRVAFKLPSVTDSRTILDSGGAEALLGNGDMLYKPGDKSSPIRVQGAFLSDDEVETVVEYIKKTNPAEAGSEIENEAYRQLEQNFSGQQTRQSDNDNAGRDEYFADAGRLIISSQKASIGGLQRKFKIGFNRAARIMDQLCEAGVVSEGEGTKERQIIMDADAFEEMLNS